MDASIDAITAGMKKLATNEEKKSFNFLVKDWVKTEEREYLHSKQLGELNAELTLGSQPVSEEDWTSVLNRIYGAEVLSYLLSDKRAVDIGIMTRLEETRHKPRACCIFDWIQSSEAGYLRYPPLVDWLEPVLDPALHKLDVHEPIALGVGTQYAVILAQKKGRSNGIYNLYCARLDIEGAFYPNNANIANIKDVIGKASISAIRESVTGDICAYRRCGTPLPRPPETGFVSGSHVVLCWSDAPDNPNVFVVEIFKLPECLPGDGYSHRLEAPVGAVAQLCLLYPFIAFSTSTLYFDMIHFIRNATNYRSVYAQLKELKVAHPTKDIDLVVTFDVANNAIHRVIPVHFGLANNVSLYPRMTSPLDANLPRSAWRISWSLTNEAHPYVHGHTFTQPFFITAEEAVCEGGPNSETQAFYWANPEKELRDDLENQAPLYQTPCIEPCRAILHYPGGHVVQISEHNMSTFVAKNGQLFPDNRSYHSRQSPVVDAVIHAGMHILLTPEGKIQIAQLRVAGSVPMTPQFALSESDLTAALGRVLPEGYHLSKDSEDYYGGHYKAIWTGANFSMAVQLCNGVIVFMRPRSFNELCTYFEQTAKSEAQKLNSRAQRLVAEKQLREAQAQGIEPLGVTLARKEAEEADKKKKDSSEEAAPVPAAVTAASSSANPQETMSDL